MKLGFLVILVFSIDFFLFYGNVCGTPGSVSNFVTVAGVNVTDSGGGSYHPGILVPVYDIIQRVFGNNTTSPPTDAGSIGVSPTYPDYEGKSRPGLIQFINFVGGPLNFVGCTALPIPIQVFVSGIWIILTAAAIVSFIRGWEL